MTAGQRSDSPLEGRLTLLIPPTGLVLPVFEWQRVQEFKIGVGVTCQLGVRFIIMFADRFRNPSFVEESLIKRQAYRRIRVQRKL